MSPRLFGAPFLRTRQSYPLPCMSNIALSVHIQKDPAIGPYPPGKEEWLWALYRPLDPKTHWRKNGPGWLSSMASTFSILGVLGDPLLESNAGL